MLYRYAHANENSTRHRFFIDVRLFPQTLDVLLTRAEPLGIEWVLGKWEEARIDEQFFGAIVQYPDQEGAIHDYRSFISQVHAAGAYVVMATDLLALTLLMPPGEMDADVAVGSTQRFGVPMGYGGPHAAFFAAKEMFKRFTPGRIIGVSVDSQGNQALRMALQTREQHIKREKATSNICTAQALLANMAAMYAVYHGPEGLKNIALRVHQLTTALYEGLHELGYACSNNYFLIPYGLPQISPRRSAALPKLTVSISGIPIRNMWASHSTKPPHRQMYWISCTCLPWLKEKIGHSLRLRRNHLLLVCPKICYAAQLSSLIRCFINITPKPA